MDNSEMYRKAIQFCIGGNEDNGRHYIEPMWREILENEGIQMSPEEESRIFEMLHLAVKKADALNDKTGFVVNWIYDAITSSIDPAMMKEESEYIKNVMDYMRLNDQLKDKEKELNARQEIMDGKEDVEEMFPQMEFGKL